MVEGLLKEQIRTDADIVGMLASYNGHPAFFYQKSPLDTDRGWQKGKSCYPRIDYNIDLRYDPERKAGGSLTVNIWCSSENAVMPEDIEQKLTSLINGTFYTTQEKETVCAIWNRSDAFAFESRSANQNNVTPEIFGITLLFDILKFPEQITTSPDPVQGLNAWTKNNFPSIVIIASDTIPAVWKPIDEKPAIYWRFEGTAVSDRQNYSVDWYLGQFAAHVISSTVIERNRWLKAIIEQIQLWGEVILADSSPMFVKQISVRHGADPLREGQILLTGQYGVLSRQKSSAEHLLGNVSFTG